MAKDEDATTDVLGDSLIPVINKLQDIFSQVTVELKLGLPQVAVVGSQSSGKSSVLEALVGRDFLPRGPDICTRAEIQSETDRVSGGHKNISDKPIRLKIFSPHPTNIEQRIREMVLQYIREPSCIILAVSASNTDLANSDALQMAQLVDADGSRTIGVLTKLDIMDRGTNAVAALRNMVVPLRLGYVAVVNRSQADINSSKSMKDAKMAEQLWFESHPEYSEVLSQCGVGNLARRINVILGNHIRLMLPSLRRQITEALETKTSELKRYGPPLDLRSESASLPVLGMFVQLAAVAQGAPQGHSEDMPLSELMGGARIRHIFMEVFGQQLRALDPFRELTDEDVRTAIKNSSGVAGTLLIPQEPFELLVRRSIGRLLAPSLNCKELVHEELLKIAEAASPKDLGRFPALQRRLATAVIDYIQAGAEPAEKMIRELVACEHEYINTDHPDFIGGTRAVKAVMEGREARKAAADAPDSHKDQLHKSKSAGNVLSSGSGSGMDGRSSGGSSTLMLPGPGPGPAGLSGLAGAGAGRSPALFDPEEVVEVIRLLVSNYFDIVRSNLADLVPKALMRFLVHHSQRGLQQHLIATLYRDSLAEELLCEREDVVRSRARAAAAVDALQAASNTLDDVPSELAATIANSHLGSDRGGESHTELALPARSRPAFGAERHPSMHIAAQIASATTLTMVPAAAAAAERVQHQAGAGLSGLPAIIEMSSGTAAGDDGSGSTVVAVMNGVGGGGIGKAVTIKVEGE
eukprot:gene1703-2048_t